MPDMYVVIGKEDCPWCDKAKELITAFGDVYEYFDIKKDPVMREFLVCNGLGTVPQVYLDGQLIGGYEDLHDYIGEPFDSTAN